MGKGAILASGGGSLPLSPKKWADSEAAAFADFVEALLASTAEKGDEINNQYADDADNELAAKNETADDVTRDWAFWLKYLYGF